ncbi:hypothetical protein WCP94_002680 [Bilophila wadsworthia]
MPISQHVSMLPYKWHKQNKQQFWISISYPYLAQTLLF